MKKSIIMRVSIVLFFILFGVSGFSQYANVEFGLENNLDKFIYFQKIIGFDRDGFFVLKTDHPDMDVSSKYYLERVSNLTLTKESASEIMLPVIEGKNSNFEKIFYMNKKLILFTTVRDDYLEKISLYVEYLSPEGTVKNKPKKVGEISTSNLPTDWFEVVPAKDTAEILVHYRPSFTTYNEEPVSFKVINSNLQITYDDDIILTDIKGKKVFGFGKFALGKSGKIYFHALIEKSGRKSKRKNVVEQRDNVIFCVDQDYKEVHKFVIGVKKYVPSQLSFSLDEQENIFVFGFMTKKNRKDLEGMFYQKLNPRTLKKEFSKYEKTRVKKFTREQDEQFTSKRSLATEGNAYHFYPEYIKKLSTNDVMFISELKYTTKQSFKDPKTKNEIVINNYYYQDLYLALGDENGNLKWMKRISKDQVSIDDKGYLSSISAFKEKNKMLIFYNDNKKNLKDKPPEKTKQIKNGYERKPKGTSVVVSVFNDGNPLKDPLFPKEYKKYVLVPGTVSKFDGKYYFCAVTKDSYRYGSVYFE